MRYKILRDKYSLDLESQVNAAMSDGATVAGGLVVSGIWFYQAVLLPDPEPMFRITHFMPDEREESE